MPLETSRALFHVTMAAALFFVDGSRSGTGICYIRIH